MKKNSLNGKSFFVGRRTLLVVFLLLLVPLLAVACSAADYEDYAPILYFEGEENCYPVTAQYHLDNSILETDIDTEIQYYDNILGTPDDNKIIKDYQSQEGTLGYTVYYRVDDSTDDTVIQYWMFYAFNKGELNQHEGDWEMVEVVIPSSGSKWVGYSQHHSGQRATWDQVEKDGTNIKVYVARGSHANYLRSYSGKLGLASDIVGDNGKVLKPSNYQLVELTSQAWIDEDVLWGEYGGYEDALIGKNGPPGPMYRGIDQGTLMWDGVEWGNSLMSADNTLFIGEWFMYNFVLIFIILTVVSLLLIFFRIYRRHKKYGLGPRFLSILYIDGINLKSIGNILCIVGIIVAIIGLFNPWYTLSGEINAGEFTTNGMVDIISIDGMNGFQITIPGVTGAIPMGTVLIPISLLIGISIVFLFLACIGLSRSVKLGFKYIGKGIRFMLPIIIIIIIIALMGSMISQMAEGMEGGSYATEVFDSISSSPLGGENTVTAAVGDETGTIKTQWGLGIGAILLLVSGIIMIVAGIIEVMTNKVFFEPKTPIEKPPKIKPAKEKKSKDFPPTSPAKDKGAKAKFCGGCGAKVEEGEKFCGKCGEKT